MDGRRRSPVAGLNIPSRGGREDTRASTARPGDESGRCEGVVEAGRDRRVEPAVWVAVGRLPFHVGRPFDAAFPHRIRYKGPPRNVAVSAGETDGERPFPLAPSVGDVPGSQLAIVAGMLVGCCLWSITVRWRFVSAAQAGDIGTVRTMLDGGMRADTVSWIGGIRAISMAAHSGHADIVCLLLNRGANPSYALPQAIQKHRVDIVRLLIERGGAVRGWRGHGGTSALQMARDAGNADVIRLLIAAGAQ